MTIKTPKQNKPRGTRLRYTVATFKQALDNYIAQCSNAEGQLIKEPLFIELALYLGIDRGTLDEYSKRPDYAPHVKKIKTLGEIFLNRTMEGDKANANAMFKLKTRHGYIEQQRVDVTTGGQPLGIIQLPTR